MISVAWAGLGLLVHLRHLILVLARIIKPFQLVLVHVHVIDLGRIVRQACLVYIVLVVSLEPLVGIDRLVEIDQILCNIRGLRLLGLLRLLSLLNIVHLLVVPLVSIVNPLRSVSITYWFSNPSEALFIRDASLRGGEQSSIGMVDVSPDDPLENRIVSVLSPFWESEDLVL